MLKNKERTADLFLEKIADFDFDKYYTPRIRVLCHILMWFFFTFLIFFNFIFDYGLNPRLSFLLLLRNLVCNTTFFYLLFYLVFPILIAGKKVYLIVVFFPILIVIWLIINHYFFVFIYQSGVELNVQSIQESVSFGAGQSFWSVISVKYVLSMTIVVIYAISPFLFIKILFDVARFYSLNLRTERRSNSLEIDKLNLETDFLKAQLNPHFLFNTLNNLYGLALRNDEKIPDIILQLSAIMRYTLYESNTESVLVTREITFIKNYVMLERLRHRDDMNINLEILDSSSSNYRLAPLLTFVFIENAFKYGLKSGASSFLDIKFHIVENLFYFSVFNDKDPINFDIIEGHFGGIGLENVKKRLELLYPGKYRLAIKNEPKSYGVELQIEME